MATRIQDKSRTAKKVIATGTYSTGTGAITITSGKAPRLDERGFPTHGGFPDPVLVEVTVVA